MGSLYVYAIVDQPDLDLPEIRGIGDAEISGLRTDDLMAVVSMFDGETVPLSRNNLLCHERVIEALMRERSVLPTRFGTTTDRAERIQQTLEANRDSYRANLDRVRGRVEIALRVGWEPEEDAPVARPRAADIADGRSYMQALLERSQGSRRRRDTAEDLAAKLTAGITELSDAVVEKVMPTPQLLLKAAYLVRYENVPEVRRRIETLRTEYPALSILATGPWPAYSFVEEGN
ncbi:GvpL/GvpF family gas vesicle protein [Chloroflexales bacterium ZM16-3]|nr:GvpL/GvpF family gas vesicle protein [Chloroflexales bacterium ZM16-3]